MKKENVKTAATIQDVAKASGVGVGTVSRVLNGGTNVSKETSTKVLNAIKELNYIPNSLGVKLRTNQNKVFALLIPVINHTFFAELTAQVEKEAQKYGYSILLVCSQKHVERETAIIDKLNRNEVDGVIFVTHYNHSVEELQNKNIVTIAYKNGTTEKIKDMSELIDLEKAYYYMPSN